jgi:hypothetical protein
MTKVYGASDDLIELEGFLSHEIDCFNKVATLVFDDGTKAKIKYGKKYEGKSIGVWQIEVISKGTGFVELQECFDEDDKIYSDVLTLNNSVTSFNVSKRKCSE